MQVGYVTIAEHDLSCYNASLRRTPRVQIWDLESKSIVDELKPDFNNLGKKAQIPFCVSLAWSADGQTLYSGYTDGKIRVWTVSRTI